MEAGRNADPGTLYFEGPWRVLAALDAKYRDQELIDVIQLISRDLQYQVFHLPADTDPQSETPQPSEYSFISVGGLDYEESDTKMFVLTIIDDKSAKLRIFDTKEMDIHVARTGDNVFPEELMKWIRDDMDHQVQLGSAVPNRQELERFEEIVNSWEQLDAGREDQD